MNLRNLLKPFALAAGLTVGVAAPIGSAAAQDAPAVQRGERGARGPHAGHRGRRGHRGRFLQELNLSEAQREQMRSIRESTREQHRALRESGDRAAMRALHERTREQMRAILTPAQVAQIGELRQAHAAERLERRVTGMTERLSLSPTQAQQVRGILQQAASQRRALAEAARLDGNSPREAMQALRERTQASIRSVLTAEQAAQLAEMRERRGRRGHMGRGHRGERGPRGERGARGQGGARGGRTAQ